MQQHPIPQNITAYKFRLVGDMTLKQFLELAFGLVSAWLIFNSNLVFIFKWTLGPILALFGFALAFMPVEDRPLDQWIINFIKSIYSPTQFIYKASPKTLDIFSLTKPIPENQLEPQLNPNQLQDYLNTLPQSPETIFDQSEKKYLNYIKNLFGILGSSPTVQSKSSQLEIIPRAKSNVKGIRIRKLHHPKMCLLPHT
ncbi:MAG: PrgI family protein, partial [Candidatus Beckwithbacteria bacterium]